MNIAILITGLLFQSGTDIDELVERLGSDSIVERTDATEELRKLGRPAWKKLRELVECDDAEVASRARLITADIRKGLMKKALELQVKTEARDGYTWIRVGLKNVEEFDVLAAKSAWALAGVKIHVYKDGKPVNNQYAGEWSGYKPITASKFVTLGPGESTMLRESEYRLEAGTYQVKAIYDFGSAPGRQYGNLQMGEPQVELKQQQLSSSSSIRIVQQWSAESLRLFDRSWRGSLKTTVKLVVD